MGCCFPYQTHRCYCPLDDLHSIVFYYGISTYLALPHTFPIASTMGMVWLCSIPKRNPPLKGTATYFVPSHSIPIQAFCCLYGIAMGCEAPCTIPFPYYPSLLLLIWDCYGLKSTIQFPYYPSILHVADMKILL